MQTGYKPIIIKTLLSNKNTYHYFSNIDAINKCYRSRINMIIFQSVAFEQLVIIAITDETSLYCSVYCIATTIQCEWRKIYVN